MKKGSIAILGSLFLVGLACLCLCLAAQKHPSPRTVRAADLLVDLTAFPAGWMQDGRPLTPDISPNVLADENANDYAGVGFTPLGRDSLDVSADHEIWGFGSTLWATIQFYTRFRPSKPGIPTPQVLRAWSYRSQVADRFRLFCWRQWGCGNCAAVAQYGEFISKVRVSLRCEDHAPVADLETILTAIDERMAKELYRPSSYGSQPTLATTTPE